MFFLFSTFYIQVLFELCYLDEYKAKGSNLKC